MKKCFRTAVLMLLFVLPMALSGCRPTDGGEKRTPLIEEEMLRLDLGRKATDELIRYYAGGMLQPPADPFSSGLVLKDGGNFYLNLDTLGRVHPWAADQLKSLAEGESAIDWDRFADFVETAHGRLRAQPPTLEQMYDQFQKGDATDRLTVEVIGVMSTMKRSISIGRAELVSALQNFRANGDRVLFPVGTAIVAEHSEANSLREVTVMRKREDEHWDFFAYGADGRPARSTLARPRALNVPTQCVGCHFGGKLYEPEKSFPARAPDGPYGPRVLYVPESEKDLEVVRFFDEHRKRSDHVLGLYATIFVSRLRQERAAGSIDANMLALLNELGI